MSTIPGESIGNEMHLEKVDIPAYTSEHGDKKHCWLPIYGNVHDGYVPVANMMFILHELHSRERKTIMNPTYLVFSSC